MFAFLLTPIIWHADNMPPGSLRGTLMRFNPFYHLVELVRAPILGQSIDVSTPMYLAVMSVGGWIIAVSHIAAMHATCRFGCEAMTTAGIVLEGISLSVPLYVQPERRARSWLAMLAGAGFGPARRAPPRIF